MKTKYRPLFCAAGLSVLIPGLQCLHAQESPAFEQSITIKLIVSSTAPSLKPRDASGKKISGPLVYFNEWNTYKTTSKGYESTENEETGSKIVRTRISNREVLEYLIRKGVILGPLKGWSLRAITRVNLDDEEMPDTLIPEFQAVKGTMRVPLDIFGLTEAGYAVQSSSRETYKETLSGTTERQSFTASFRDRGLSCVGFTIQLDELIEGNGLLATSASASASVTATKVKYKIGLGAMRLDRVSGIIRLVPEDGLEPVQDEVDSNPVVEGSIRLSTGKITSM